MKLLWTKVTSNLGYGEEGNLIGLSENADWIPPTGLYEQYEIGVVKEWFLANC